MKRKLFSASLLALVAVGGAALAQTDESGNYNWTGVYLGVNLGGAFLTSCPDISPEAPGVNPLISGNSMAAVYTGNCPKPNSFIGGGQIGFNYQWNSIVFGIEGDIGGGTGGASSYTRTTTGSPDGSIPAGTFRITGGHTPSSIETIRGRLGYATQNWLFYVTGGGTFSGGIAETTATFTPSMFPSQGGPAPTATFTATNHGTRIGWNIGGGVEYHLGHHWSVKLEDLYEEVGTYSTSPTVCAGTECSVFVNGLEAYNSRNYLTINVIRVGVNYLFGF
jgi:outer membrane immunogenic protein